MTKRQAVEFIDNNTATTAGYICVTVDVAKTLASWRGSLFSFEWLEPDGKIKAPENLSEHEKPKWQDVEDFLNKGRPVIKPVLGIGIHENVEIGSGRAVFLTLAARGVQAIPVHIPKSNERDFQAFLADVDSRDDA